MPTQNIGTLVGAAIRPIDDTTQIASAFAFEINGGHHQVATLAARNLIMVQRRQWGMLCTVYNDPTVANNATYQLKYGHFSTNTEDNQNWVVFLLSLSAFLLQRLQTTETGIWSGRILPNLSAAPSRL